MLNMKNEITVLINSSMEELDNDLKKQGFKQVAYFVLDDIYLIPQSTNPQILKFHNVLKRCLILRKNNDNYKIVYKQKDYANNGDILDQMDINYEVHDPEYVIRAFETLNYKVFIRVYDECTVYDNGEFSLISQWVNNEHLMIEMENTSPRHDYEFKTIDEMIQKFKTLNLDYDDSNYFISKAKLIYEKDSYQEY